MVSPEADEDRPAEWIVIDLDDDPIRVRVEEDDWSQDLVIVTTVGNEWDGYTTFTMNASQAREMVAALYKAIIEMNNRTTHEAIGR